MKILVMNSNDKKKVVLGLTRNCGLVLKNTLYFMNEPKQNNQNTKR